MNAVTKPDTRLESIYDHHITDTELSDMFYGQPDPKDEYLLGYDQDDLMVDIVHLYRMRNQPNKVMHYISMIRNPSIRSEMLTLGCCSVRS